MTEERISSRQAIMLLAGFFLGSIIVMNPAADAGEDAWFSFLVGWAAGFIVMSIVAALATLHQGKSLLDILIFCFGKKAGKIIGFFYVIYFLWLAGEVTRSFCWYSMSVDYSETPLLFIAACYMIVIAFVVKIGLEAMGRISEILLILVILMVTVTFLSFFVSFQPDVFLPMFKNGIAQPAAEGLKTAMLPFGEGICALTILPNLVNTKKAFKVTSYSVLLAGGIMFVILLRDTTVLGVNIMSRSVFPSEKVYRLLPGIDVYPLLDIDVVIVGVLKVSLALYAAAKTLGELFGLKDFKIFVLPLAAFDIAYLLTMHYDLFSQLYFADNLVPLFGIPYLLIMPLIMLVISLIKKDSQKGPVQQLE